MIIDCFTFFSELDILEGRLEYLYDHVDYFVIVEGNVTHTGKPKPLNFLANISRYKSYLDKVLYFPWTYDTANMTFEKPETVDYDSSNWKLENKQRNHISEALKFFSLEDICLISDVDEIPSKTAIQDIKIALKGVAAVSLEQEMYSYNLNQRQFSPWAGTVATKIGIALDQTPQTIRDKRWGDMPILRGSGWHLTHWGGAKQIQNKLNNFAHQELINDRTSSIEYIQSRIDQGQDLFGRNLPYVKVNPYDEPIDFLRAFGKYVGIYVDSKLIAPYADTVEGRFGPGDMSFYTMIYDQLPSNSHIVEIGSWKGRSSSHMAVMIANGNKKIKFDCVDTWEGSDVLNKSLYNSFLKNMEPVKDYFTPIRKTSLDAAELYTDSSLDFVFIDAAHDYKNVRADILAWKEKVKPGGILSGHDYPCADVQRAVHELLVSVEVIGQCWYIRK